MMMIINPGTGPVTSATEANAKRNMRALRREVLAHDPALKISFARFGSIERGRYGYAIWGGKVKKTKPVEIDMPGCTLEVLTARSISQPRLYVDGSSWYWEYAVDIVIDELTGRTR